MPESTIIPGRAPSFKGKEWTPGFRCPNCGRALMGLRDEATHKRTLVGPISCPLPSGARRSYAVANPVASRSESHRRASATPVLSRTEGAVRAGDP